MDMILDISKLISPTGKTYGEEFKIATKLLKDCLQNSIDNWYDTFLPANRYTGKSEPVIYKRTYKLKNSMEIDDIVRISEDGNALSTSVIFMDNKINHESLYAEGDVNVLWLMNYGYSVKKNVWFKNIHNFGRRKGGGFIEKGIEEFNKVNSLGFKVTPTYYGDEITSGKYLRGNYNMY